MSYSLIIKHLDLCCVVGAVDWTVLSRSSGCSICNFSEVQYIFMVPCTLFCFLQSAREIMCQNLTSLSEGRVYKWGFFMPNSRALSQITHLLATGKVRSVSLSSWESYKLTLSFACCLLVCCTTISKCKKVLKFVMLQNLPRCNIQYRHSSAYEVTENHVQSTPSYHGFC